MTILGVGTLKISPETRFGALFPWFKGLSAEKLLKVDAKVVTFWVCAPFCVLGAM
jgi:hypothetical protein